MNYNPCHFIYLFLLTSYLSALDRVTAFLDVAFKVDTKHIKCIIKIHAAIFFFLPNALLQME